MKKIKRKISISPIVFYTITLLFLEIVGKIVLCNQYFNIGLLYMVIFTLPITLLLTILTKMFNRVINKILLFIITFIITVYFEVQYIFFILFSVPFSFSTIGLADQALDFTSIVKDTIFTHLPIFITLLIPFILLIIINKKINVNRYNKYQISSIFIMLIIAYLSTFLSLAPEKDKYNSSYKLYFKVDDPISMIDRFGMLTYSKIDIKRQLLGYENEIILEQPNIMPGINNQTEEIEPGEIDYGYNQLELNFEKETKSNEVKQLNQLFSNSMPSNKTEYTGMFKGKNLIFILAEGFNEVAVDENRTPTLYKMVHNGFVFNEFYSPVFLSTTGGEFQATTGLIATQETLNYWKSKTPTMSYGLGNAFGQLGYRVQSYHDWTHTYYKRQVTMKTLGYENYLGCGNGLEKRMNCGWLPFDSEMINVTTPDYLGQEGNFLTYYVTVSGHSPYNVNDNIGRKYYDNLKDTNYSTGVKYYLAAQMELDKMMETLIAKLEESGELENTVIALVGDHYPYTLSIEEMNEAATYQKDSIIEVNHSNFILWNSEIEEPIVVDKVGSQIDVLPTLLNLFGIDYDSRLIVGKDILSDYDGIAIFSNRSWVSDYGRYYAGSRKFVLKDGKYLENQSEYIQMMNNRVANAFSTSKLIMNNNYYNYILDK